MRQQGTIYATFKYSMQLAAFRKCYPNETTLTAWPYGVSGIGFVLTIKTYGEFCEVQDNA